MINNILMKRFRKISFETISYYSLLLFAFLMPLSRAAISFFIFWFVILLIFKKDYKNTIIELKDNKIFFYFLLYCLYSLLTSFWSEDHLKTITYIRMTFYIIAVPCIVILAKKEWLYSILNAFLYGMLISEIISYGIYFEILKGNPMAPSPFMITIHYSIFLAFSSLVLLYRFLYENTSLKIKIVLFLFFLITTTNLAISTGRTGQLAFLITLFIVFIIKYKISIKAILLSFCFVCTIFLVSYNTLNIFKNRIDTTVIDVKNILNKNFDGSWGIRAGFWIITYDALKEKPFFGYGLGNHIVAAKKIVEKNNYPFFQGETKDFLTSNHYHNQFLMILVQSGIIGLFLFLFFMYKMLKLKINDPEIKHISIIGISVFLISCLGEPLLILQFPLVLFIFIISISIIGSKK